jgi:hypothetical protein
MGVLGSRLDPGSDAYRANRSANQELLVELNRIFAPFQRLGDRDNASGVGLGLALSRGLVEATGGTLTPDTTLGGGLTMIFRLPAAEPAEDGPDQAADPALLDHIEHWRVDDGRGART